jgi:hypothetical protein
MENKNKHFGIVNLEIHYSLAAGLAEQLGDNVEQAAVAAISKIGSSDKQFFVNNQLIRMDQHWHPCHSTAKPTNAVSIHLSSDLDGDCTYSVDWECF